VYIDETWASTSMTRRYGRCDRHLRLIDKVPHGHWKTTTLIAALRSDGVTAPMVVDGAIEGGLFLAYVRQMLCPTLRPGDVVVLDNLSSHKVSGCRGDRKRGRGGVVSAALQPGLQPHRAGVREGEADPAEAQGADDVGVVGGVGAPPMNVRPASGTADIPLRLGRESNYWKIL